MLRVTWPKDEGSCFFAAAVGGGAAVPPVPPYSLQIGDGENGLLVPVGDAPALASALVRFASDRPLAERLAAAARPSAEGLLTQPEEYAQRVASLVAAAVDR